MKSAHGGVVALLLALSACSADSTTLAPISVGAKDAVENSTPPSKSDPPSKAAETAPVGPVAPAEKHAYVEGTETDGTEGGLALRSGPSTDASLVMVIPEGSRVRLTGEPANDFTPISFAGHDGWAHTEYLDFVDRGGTSVDVPWIAQMPELPRGCEVTSLAMLLRHAGAFADKMKLASQIDKVPYDAGSGRHGNPNDGFVGDMYDFGKPGYGAYHAPVRRLAESYLPKRIVDLTGASFDALLDDYLGTSRPVWVIVNAKFRALDPSALETWKTPSGDVRITWEEHSVVIVGYDSHSVFIDDPLDANGKNKRIERKAFRAAWEQMGRQAISYLPSP